MIDRDYHGAVCMACENIILHSATPEDMGRMRWMGLMGVFSYCHYPSLFFLFSIYGTEIGKVGMVWFSSQTFLFSFLSSSFSFFPLLSLHFAIVPRISSQVNLGIYVRTHIFQNKFRETNFAFTPTVQELIIGQ